MLQPQCTIDSSCVIALDHLDLLPKLTFLFVRVLVPKAVRDDLFKRRSTKDRLQSLFDAYAFFQRCDDYDKGTVDFLLTERARARTGKKDRGEAGRDRKDSGQGPRRLHGRPRRDRKLVQLGDQDQP